jgi:hypothetical protein
LNLGRFAHRNGRFERLWYDRHPSQSFLHKGKVTHIRSPTKTTTKTKTNPNPNPNSSSTRAQNVGLDAPITVDDDTGLLLWRTTNSCTFVDLVSESQLIEVMICQIDSNEIHESNLHSEKQDLPRLSISHPISTCDDLEKLRINL